MASIRDDAADLGYHDELAVDLIYTWDEERAGQDEPMSKTKHWDKRSKDHAVDGLLFGPYADADDRRAAVREAMEILDRWNHSEYDHGEIDLLIRNREEIDSTPETRPAVIDPPEDVDVTVYRKEPDPGRKDMDAAEYCTKIVGAYIDNRIDHDLWHEKPAEVAEICRRNDDELLADAVDMYAQQPKLIVGHNVYTERIDPEDAETPEEYLDGLVKKRFQPI